MRPVLQVDPSQKKAVVILLVALAGAIGFLAVRMMPGGRPQQAAAQAATEEAKPAAAVTGGDVRVDPARNPFQRPAGIARTATAPEQVDSGIQIVPFDRTERLPEACAVRPMPVPGFETVEHPDSHAARPKAGKSEKPGSGTLETVMMGGASSPSGKASDAHRQDEAPRPSFKLLATVKSGGVYSAVLRVGESEARVVEVGDVIDGRYKVARLQDNLAVLLDGREVIIATRPGS